MANEARKWTCRLLDALDEGILDTKDIIRMCTSYMSESEVEDMLRLNDLQDYLNPQSEEDEISSEN